MARPIKETPILTGKDAVRFKKIIQENERRKVSASEIQKGRQAYERFGFARKTG